MHDHENPQANPDINSGAAVRIQAHELIKHLMLKPSADVMLDASQPLSADYVQDLQASVGDEVRLSYVRPMSMGMHVLALEPALEREVAVALAERLSARSDVEYAEPDFPRRRR